MAQTKAQLWFGIEQVGDQWRVVAQLHAPCLGGNHSKCKVTDKFHGKHFYDTREIAERSMVEDAEAIAKAMGPESATLVDERS